MNAKCTGCGKFVEFSEERRGLLEKCAACAEVFELQEVSAGEPPRVPTPKDPMANYVQEIRKRTNYTALRMWMEFLAMWVFIAAMAGVVIVAASAFGTDRIIQRELADYKVTWEAQHPTLHWDQEGHPRLALALRSFVFVIGAAASLLLSSIGLFMSKVVKQAMILGIDAVDMLAEQGSRT